MKIKTKTSLSLLALAAQLTLPALLVNPAQANNTVLNGSSPRPFYVFAHNPNDLDSVTNALLNGCNAFEPDISTVTCGGTKILIDFDPDAGGIPDCQETKWVEWCDAVHDLALQYPQLALVAIDIKSDAAKSGFGTQIMDTVRNHLNTNGVNLNVIYSIPDTSNGEVFDNIIGKLGPREGVQVDADDSPDAVLNYFFGRGYFENIGYGDGTSTPGPDLPRAIDRAAFLRATIGEPKALTYVSLISTESSMHSFINAGVDGMIVTDGSQTELVGIVTNSHPEIRMGTRDDNPFQTLKEAYGLEIKTSDVEYGGTDADLTFTLNGCRGTATITVNTGYINALLNSGRMEQDNTDYVTIPSADLGHLNSITVHHNGNPDDDWHLQEIRVSSLRWLGMNVGHAREYKATFNNWIKKGDTVPLTLTPSFAEPVPTIQCPAPIVVPNDLNQCGAVVQFSAAVDGPCDDVTAACSPASGSFFVVGQTVVTCLAQSPSGPQPPASCMFTVTVQDTQPPVITCPQPITVANTQNQCGAVVKFVPVVQGPCDDVTAICSPASGTSFPVGQTLVTCFAESATGPKSSPCTFMVTVVDNQPPVIACPAPIVTKATSPAGVFVTYAMATASDNCPGATISCLPASGGVFPIGNTTVTCTATDASANQAWCSFNVHVKGAKEQLADLIALVKASAIKSSIKNAMLVNLNAALASLVANNTVAACGSLQAFIDLVNSQKGKAITASDANTLIAAATQIRAVIGCTP